MPGIWQPESGAGGDGHGALIARNQSRDAVSHRHRIPAFLVLGSGNEEGREKREIRQLEGGKV